MEGSGIRTDTVKHMYVGRQCVRVCVCERERERKRARERERETVSVCAVTASGARNLREK
jgi:hypothetical protein